MEFVNKLLESLFGWLPAVSWSVDISVVTPADKAKVFLLAVIAGLLLYKHLVKPVILTLWVIGAALVCAISLLSLSIYAAWKFKRLHTLPWPRLPLVILARWLDFTTEGFRRTTITAEYYIWSGPFSWALKYPQAMRDKKFEKQSGDDLDLPG